MITCWALVSRLIQKTLTFTSVAVPEISGTIRSAVLYITTGLNDAFTAFRIESGTWWTGVRVKFAVASAGIGVPIAVCIAVDALAAIVVELKSWAREYLICAKI